MPTTRTQFLILATAFQGSLGLAGVAAGSILGTNPFDQINVSFSAVLVGLTGSIPMLILFGATYRFPIGPLKPIKEFLLETLGPILQNCHWYDLIWIAVLAGVSEELVFRGVAQSLFSQNHWMMGMLVSNTVFALAHAVTPTYAVLAGLLGGYLEMLHKFAGHGNLFVPIITHSFYDFVALSVVRHTERCAVQRGCEASV